VYVRVCVTRDALEPKQSTHVYTHIHMQENQAIPENKDTCVIMCRIVRDSPKSPWRMEAIGEFSDGQAGRYLPIFNSISTHITNSSAGGAGTGA